MIAYHNVEVRDVWIAFDGHGYIIATFYDEIKARNFVYRHKPDLLLVCDKVPAPKLIVCTDQPITTPHAGGGLRNARKPL